jgi:hypothetical protein
MLTQDGFLKILKKKDSKTGWQMQEIGASQEAEFGVIQFHFGALMI